MLAAIFLPKPPEDRYLRAADERAGAASILGITANRCFEKGDTAAIADWVKNLDRPDYAPMPPRLDVCRCRWLEQSGWRVKACKRSRNTAVFPRSRERKGFCPEKHLRRNRSPPESSGSHALTLFSTTAVRAAYLPGSTFTYENTRLLRCRLYWAAAREAKWSVSIRELAPGHLLTRSSTLRKMCLSRADQTFGRRSVGPSTQRAGMVVSEQGCGAPRSLW